MIRQLRHQRGLSLFVLLLLLAAPAVRPDLDDDDDFDEAVVEDVPEADGSSHSIDVPYSSPAIDDASKVYLAEHFDDAGEFEKRWVRSQAKKEGIAEEIAKYDGVWKLEAPLKDALTGDMGLVLKTNAKHAAIAAKLQKPFVFSNKPLVVQYEVIFQDGQECGGAYIKLLSNTKDLRQFHDKTPYSIMFGPDKCGNDHKLHFIFKHKNPLNGSLEEKHCKKPKERLEEPFRDHLPHLYTLLLRPDNTFSVRLDGQEINAGSLLEDFAPAVNPPAEIDDPADAKPQDWDDREKIADVEAARPDDWDDDAPAEIPDPAAVKPDGWLDDEPTMVPDPQAAKPDDWDVEMDGEWEAPLVDNPACSAAPGCGPWAPPMISNPNYRGKWRPPQITNPNYKGKWSPRRVPNPDYFEDKHPFRMETISAVGFELWSMSKDIFFDNIILTDDIAVAEKWAAESFALKRKKIEKESDTTWGRMMKQINHKPGMWALYFAYCLVPVCIYVWYMHYRVREESLVVRLLKYTHENPWLWGVYILVGGLPVVLLLYIFCKPKSPVGSSQEKEEQMRAAAEAKKTDSVSPDDVVQKEGSDAEGDNEAEDDEEVEEEKQVEEKVEEEKRPKPTSPNEGEGDVPRKRRQRKE